MFNYFERVVIKQILGSDYLKKLNSIWNFYAPIYNLFMHFNKKAYAKMNANIRKIIKDKTVLEIATGTGLIANNVADSAKKMTATDFAEKMIKEAQKANKNSNLTFQLEDATNLTFQDQSFDVVIISNALHVIPAPEKALAEIKRVLAPDGILIAPNFVHENLSGTSKFMSKLLNAAGIAFEAKWDFNGYVKFLHDNGFDVKKKTLIKAMIPLAYTECLLIS